LKAFRDPRLAVRGQHEFDRQVKQRTKPSEGISFNAFAELAWTRT